MSLGRSIGLDHQSRQEWDEAFTEQPVRAFRLLVGVINEASNEACAVIGTELGCCLGQPGVSQAGYDQ
jgi:hypothetical protein